MKKKNYKFMCVIFIVYMIFISHMMMAQSIGVWSGESIRENYVFKLIKIIKNNGNNYKMIQIFKDGSSRVLSVKKKGNKFYDINDPKGDYYVINNTGTLSVCDSDGVIFTFPKTKKNIVDSKYIKKTNRKKKNKHSKYWIKINKIKQIRKCEVLFDFQTNIPKRAILSLDVEKYGLSDSDIFVGISFVKYKLNRRNVKTYVNICEHTYPYGNPLPPGKYIGKVGYYPRWTDNSKFRNKIPNKIQASKVFYIK